MLFANCLPIVFALSIPPSSSGVIHSHAVFIVEGSSVIWLPWIPVNVAAEEGPCCFPDPHAFVDIITQRSPVTLSCFYFSKYRRKLIINYCGKSICPVLFVYSPVPQAVVTACSSACDSKDTNNIPLSEQNNFWSGWLLCVYEILLAYRFIFSQAILNTQQYM